MARKKGRPALKNKAQKQKQGNKAPPRTVDLETDMSGTVSAQPSSPIMSNTQTAGPAQASGSPVSESPAARSSAPAAEFPPPVPYLSIYEPHEMHFYRFGPAVEEADPPETHPQTVASTGLSTSSAANEPEQTEPTSTGKPPIEGQNANLSGLASSNDNEHINNAAADANTTTDTPVVQQGTTQTELGTSNEATCVKDTASIDEAAKSDSVGPVENDTKTIAQQATGNEATGGIQTPVKLAEPETVSAQVTASTPPSPADTPAEQTTHSFDNAPWSLDYNHVLICLALCFWVTVWRLSETSSSQSGGFGDYILVPVHCALRTSIAYLLPANTRQTLWYGLCISGLAILLFMWLSAIWLYLYKPQNRLERNSPRPAQTGFASAIRKYLRNNSVPSILNLLRAGRISFRNGIDYLYRLPGTFLRVWNRVPTTPYTWLESILLYACVLLACFVLAWFFLPLEHYEAGRVNITPRRYIPTATRNVEYTLVTKTQPPMISYATLNAEDRRRDAYISAHFSELWEAAGRQHLSVTSTSASAGESTEDMSTAIHDSSTKSASYLETIHPTTSVEPSMVAPNVNPMHASHAAAHANLSDLPINPSSQSTTVALENDETSPEVDSHESSLLNTAQAMPQAAPTTSYTIAAVFTHSQAAHPTTIRGPLFSESSARESIRTTHAHPRPSPVLRKHSHRPSVRRFGDLTLITLGFRPLSLAADEIAFCDQCHQRHGWTVMIAEKKIDFDLHNH